MNARLQDTPRLLLATVRKGDYAHPGDEEAIDLLLEKVMKFFSQSLANIKMLDVGCGLGGTANYIKNKLTTDVVGMDVDSVAIAYAQATYPTLKFFEKNLLTLSSVDKFQLIYTFNVLYGIEDKAACFKSLANAAEPGAVLAIFDYTKTDTSLFDLKDLAERIMHPFSMKKIQMQLSAAGWHLLEIIDLSENYLKWYAEFLQKLVDQEESLLQQFSQTTYNKVFETFSILLSHLKDKQLGGAIICASYIGS